MAVKKLPKNIANIDILFCLSHMKRYFKNIAISIYCIDVSTSLEYTCLSSFEKKKKKKKREWITQLLHPTKNVTCSKPPLERGIMQNQIVPDQEIFRSFSTIAHSVQVVFCWYTVYLTAVHRVPLNSLHKIHSTIYVRVVPS